MRLGVYLDFGRLPFGRPVLHSVGYISISPRGCDVRGLGFGA